MTWRDVIRFVRFIKLPALWVVGCLVGLIWCSPHFVDATGNTLTVDQQRWNDAFIIFIMGLVGFFVGLFSVAEAIHRIDLDERLRAFAELDNIKSSRERRVN